jgi:hypothetical protein
MEAAPAADSSARVARSGSSHRGWRTRCARRVVALRASVQVCGQPDAAAGQGPIASTPAARTRAALRVLIFGARRLGLPKSAALRSLTQKVAGGNHLADDTVTHPQIDVGEQRSRSLPGTRMWGYATILICLPILGHERDRAPMENWPPDRGT